MEPIQEFPDHHQYPVASIAFDMPSRTIITCDASAIIQWELTEEATQPLLTRSISTNTALPHSRSRLVPPTSFISASPSSTTTASLGHDSTNSSSTTTSSPSSSSSSASPLTRSWSRSGVHSWRTSQSPPTALLLPPPIDSDAASAQSCNSNTPSAEAQPRPTTPRPVHNRSATITTRSLSPTPIDRSTSPITIGVGGASGFVRRNHSSTQTTRPTFQIGGLREVRSDDSAKRATPPASPVIPLTPPLTPTSASLDEFALDSSKDGSEE
jgi:hypothetical protein